MNGRLKLIEQQLIGIDSAAFQNLCDVYLAMRERERASINRTGSMFGKQKTVKGTPDTFFRLLDGSLRYVEYTTTYDGIVAKIKDDIDKCLDEGKTGVPAIEINKIIICFNSRLKVVEETEIVTYADSKNIKIELIGLDWLALEIYSKYLILAKDILGIPLDTGQLLPLERFIEEYDNKGGKLSTPLDNKFLHRKAELEDIDQSLSRNDVVIISGFPGVGKTKIAIEALNKFFIWHLEYEILAVSKKDMDISDDLRIHLETENDYVLFVDDVNRQLVNFRQILGVFREKRKGRIKLLLTVRNYAFDDVKNECSEFEPHEVTIDKFTDQEIIDLIASDSFQIANPTYQKRIVEIADGNARLAVMAARLAKQQQQVFLWGNVSDLYDSYFQTFIKDSDLFENKILIKTLGIVSFFFTIDRNNKIFVSKLMEQFNLDYYIFNEAVDDLHRRELVEVQYDHVRVSEQVMSTYFFYKVFIKDELLSFRTLLFSYFPEWKKRFFDSIIPSNNSFGYDSVIKRIDGVLSDYLRTIGDDESKVSEFFSLFWFYKREELLAYFFRKIKKIPEPIDPIYDAHYDHRQIVWDRENTLDLLAHLFHHPTESLAPGLELAFEYIRRKPEFLPELVRTLREVLVFDQIDENSSFERQTQLINLLTGNFNEAKPHYMEAFFELAPMYLQHHFRITKGGRNNSINFYYYPLPLCDSTMAIREKIWTTLFNSYEKHPTKVVKILTSFKPGFEKSISNVLAFDLSFILPFIEKNLPPTELENVHFVRNFVRWLDGEDVGDRNYRRLKDKYVSKSYQYVQKLDWNQIRGKQEYEFDNYEDFMKLKETDIRTSFRFSSSNEFKDLQEAVQNFLAIDAGNTWSISQSLDIIAEETFVQNHDLGFSLLENILQYYPDELNPLGKPIAIIVNQSTAWAHKLWHVFEQWNKEQKFYWQLTFFEHLPPQLCDDYFGSELLAVFKSLKVSVGYLRFDSFKKFIPLDRDIITKILLIVVKKIEEKQLIVRIELGFFEKYSPYIADTELLSRAYLQQEKIHPRFDLISQGLEVIVTRNPEFLFHYIETHFTGKTWQGRSTDARVPFVWDMDNYAEIVEKAIDLIVDNTFYLGLGDYALSILFSHLNESRQEKAKQFILEYISRHNANVKKMNAIFDAIKKQFSNFFETAVLHYLSLNSELNYFKQISWIGNGGVYHGEVILGEIHAKEWQAMMAMVEKSPNQLDMIPIKAYLKERIGNELKSAEVERKMKFINPD